MKVIFTKTHVNSHKVFTRCIKPQKAFHCYHFWRTFSELRAIVELFTEWSAGRSINQDEKGRISERKYIFWKHPHLSFSEKTSCGALVRKSYKKRAEYNLQQIDDFPPLSILHKILVFRTKPIGVRVTTNKSSFCLLPPFASQYDDNFGKSNKRQSLACPY